MVILGNYEPQVVIVEDTPTTHFPASDANILDNHLMSQSFPGSSTVYSILVIYHFTRATFVKALVAFVGETGDPAPLHLHGRAPGPAAPAPAPAPTTAPTG